MYFLHRISPHIVKIRARRLSDFKNSLELVATLYDAILGTFRSHDCTRPVLTLIAHEGYYKAGIIHGDVSLANICIFEGRKDDGKRRQAGALLDLDQCQSCQRFIPVSMKFENTAEADVD